MLVRIWRVKIHPDRIEDLEAFAQAESTPMFRAQPGCLGVLFTRSGLECLTISLWDSAESVERLRSSPSYDETVRRIEASGILDGGHKIELLESFGGFLDLRAAARALGQIR
ncbi:MAG: antibiotic biosynthesis monooxygenase [Anaerolineales bacterium]|nr:antibiotic biosynthesis monooxygenase [Anaerolineales bacterium]